MHPIRYDPVLAFRLRSQLHVILQNRDRINRELIEVARRNSILRIEYKPLQGVNHDY